MALGLSIETLLVKCGKYSRRHCREQKLINYKNWYFCLIVAVVIFIQLSCSERGVTVF